MAGLISIIYLFSSYLCIIYFELMFYYLTKSFETLQPVYLQLSCQLLRLIRTKSQTEKAIIYLLQIV